jgi:hypothetical protein
LLTFAMQREANEPDIFAIRKYTFYLLILAQ